MFTRPRAGKNQELIIKCKAKKLSGCSVDEHKAVASRELTDSAGVALSGRMHAWSIWKSDSSATSTIKVLHTSLWRDGVLADE